MMNPGFTALLFFMTFLRIAPGFVVMDLEQAHRIMEEQRHSLQPLDGSFGPFVQMLRQGQELGGSFGNTRDELRALFTKHLRDQARRF